MAASREAYSSSLDDDDSELETGSGSVMDAVWFRTDFEKRVLLDNFERRGWVRCDKAEYEVGRRIVQIARFDPECGRR